MPGKPTLLLATRRKNQTDIAEERGFEPLVELPPRRFSKPLPSTTRPFLQLDDLPCSFAGSPVVSAEDYNGQLEGDPFELALRQNSSKPMPLASSAPVASRSKWPDDDCFNAFARSHDGLVPQRHQEMR